MSPIVYLLEEQIRALFSKPSLGKQIIPGEAYAWDDNTVIHAYTNTPRNHPAGHFIHVKFVVLHSGESFIHTKSTLSSIRSSTDGEYPILLIVLGIEDTALKHNAFLSKAKTDSLECDVRFIPIKSDLYSRSKGLLETEVLETKTVGIVGLGSGGSPIAVELAKAGVGHFVLMDFDRLELSNVSRHICGVSDLGRYKTFAVRDAVLQRNPHAEVKSLEIDINQHRTECSDALSKVDLIVCASDNDRSRFFLNEIALKFKITTLFGRAITRAAGGDVLRVRPLQGPCYSCLYSQNVRQQGSDDEEISQRSQAKSLLPSYTSESDLKAVVQVGLSSDILPISTFMVKLALLELSKGINTGIKSLEEDLVSDFYIWANRRDGLYEGWTKLEYNFNKPSILRWYGAKVVRDPNCMVCGV